MNTAIRVMYPQNVERQFWRTFGLDMHIRLGEFHSETLQHVSALFGNYGLIADLLDTEHKMHFYCFVARFLFILENICSSRMGSAKRNALHDHHGFRKGL